MGKLTIETFYGGDQTEPSVLSFIGSINFTYMSGILFAIVVVLVLAVSHLTSPPDEEQIRGLTYASIDHADVRRSWNTFDLIATLIVLGLTFGFYVYFSLKTSQLTANELHQR
jgi:SSS family solute:Na+ symporter